MLSNYAVASEEPSAGASTVFWAASCHAGIDALLFKKLNAPLVSSALTPEVVVVVVDAICEADEEEPEPEVEEAYEAVFHAAGEAPGAPGPGARRFMSKLLRDLISDCSSFKTFVCDSLFFSIS